MDMPKPTDQAQPIASYLRDSTLDKGTKTNSLNDTLNMDVARVLQLGKKGRMVGSQNS
jgi:hypothetical protein